MHHHHLSYRLHRTMTIYEFASLHAKSPIMCSQRNILGHIGIDEAWVLRLTLDVGQAVQEQVDERQKRNLHSPDNVPRLHRSVQKWVNVRTMHVRTHEISDLVSQVA